MSSLTAFRRSLAVAFVVILCVTSAFAHAVLVQSIPAQNGVIDGTDVAITLKFNVRIDAARSKLQLVLPGGKSQVLSASAGATPNVLQASAKGLHPGKYKLVWQVLASDGHITRGEISFSAK